MRSTELVEPFGSFTFGHDRAGRVVQVAPWGRASGDPAASDLIETCRLLSVLLFVGTDPAELLSYLGRGRPNDGAALAVLRRVVKVGR